MFEFVNQIWFIWLDLAPWMLLGMLLAGMLHVLGPAPFFQRQLHGSWGVVKSVLFGIPLPLCSCGVIPAGVGLKKNGASDGAAIGFLISTPQTGIDSILVSGSLLGWPFALFKMGAALVTGVAGGLAVNQLGLPTSTPPPAETCRTNESQRRGWIDVWEHAVEILRSIWLWLVMGVVVSAIISLYWPLEWTLAVNQWGLWASMLLMLVLSLPWYVCATASVPIAAALIDAGFPTGAAMVFLMAGPATNLATVGAVAGTFGWRVLTIYLIVIILGSMAGGWIYDIVFGGFSTRAAAHQHQHHTSSWLVFLCGLALLAMVVWLAGQTVKRVVMKLRSPRHSDRVQSFRVAGMHCQNCVHRLETTLRKSGMVEQVSIELKTGEVVVRGAISADQIDEAVRGCGYQVVEPA